VASSVPRQAISPENCGCRCGNRCWRTARPDAVGADQRQRQILLAAHGGAADHRQSLGVGGEVLELAAEPQFDIVMFPDFGLQRRLQIDAMHHPIGRAGGSRGGFAERQPNHSFAAAARAHQADGFRGDGAPGEGVPHVEIDQDAAGIGRELQPGADFLEPFGLLQDDDAKTFCRERQRGRQSPDPGTSDEDRA